MSHVGLEHFDVEYFRNYQLDEYTADFVTRRVRELDRTLEQPAERGVRVCELGCAFGFALTAFRSQGWDAVGIEGSKHGCLQAKRRGCDVLLGDVSLGLPFRDSSFDAVAAYELVEHMHDPPALFSEIHRVLANHGLFQFSTPNLHSYPWKRAFFSWDDRDPTHVSLDTPAGWKRLLRNKGFTLESLQTVTFRLPWSGFKRAVAGACARVVSRFGLGSDTQVIARKV